MGFFWLQRRKNMTYTSTMSNYSALNGFGRGSNVFKFLTFREIYNLIPNRVE